MLKAPWWVYWISAFGDLIGGIMFFGVVPGNRLSGKLLENFGILAGYKEKKP